MEFKLIFENLKKNIVLYFFVACQAFCGTLWHGGRKSDVQKIIFELI